MRPVSYSKCPASSSYPNISCRKPRPLRRHAHESVQLEATAPVTRMLMVNQAIRCFTTGKVEAARQLLFHVDCEQMI